MALEVMHIKELDRRIELIRVSNTQSGSGAVTETETVLATVFARVSEGAGDEEMDLDKVTAVGIAMFRVRYRQMLYTDRIRYQGNVYDIVNIQEVPRKQGLDIKARRRI